MKKPEQIKNVIGPILKNIQLKRKQPQTKIIASWPDIVGDKIARHSQPLKLAAGRLIVGVESPAWINELTFLKTNIIKKIKEQTGLPLKEIVFRVQ